MSDGLCESGTGLQIFVAEVLKILITVVSGKCVLDFFLRAFLCQISDTKPLPIIA